MFSREVALYLRFLKMVILQARESFVVLVSVSWNLALCRITWNHICHLQQDLNHYFIPRYFTLFYKPKDLTNLHKIYYFLTWNHLQTFRSCSWWIVNLSTPQVTNSANFHEIFKTILYPLKPKHSPGEILNCFFVYCWGYDFEPTSK